MCFVYWYRSHNSGKVFLGTWNKTRVALKVLKTEAGISPSHAVRYSYFSPKKQHMLRLRFQAIRREINVQILNSQSGHCTDFWKCRHGQRCDIPTSYVIFSISSESAELLTSSMIFRIPWSERVGWQTVHRHAIPKEWKCSRLSSKAPRI
jgi:hypothetical protein